jgi:outer membrane autotransporter protein
MNTIYRIVWSAATGKWVVASELAKSRTRTNRRRFTPLAVGFLLAAVATAQVHADTINFPSGSTVDIGSDTRTIDGLTVSNGATGTIVGADGTLIYNGGDFRIGGTASNTVQNLDMRGLSNFVFDSPTAVFSASGRATGGAANTTGVSNTTLNLASGTNVITASSFGVADTSRSVQGSATNQGTVRLGQTNTINANVITIGTNQTNGTLNFQDGVSGGTVKIRGTDGVSAVSNWNIATGSNSNYSGAVGLADFSAGTLDAKVDTLTIATSVFGTNPATGTFSMGLGLLDANTILLGQRTSTSGAGNTTARLNIGGGGTVLANTVTMGVRTGTTGAVSSTINLNGGALRAGSIVAGAGTATRVINFNNGVLGNYADGQDMTVNVPIALAATGTHTFQVDGADALMTVSGVTSGAGGTLNKAGAGTLALTANNTYTGGTTVNEGLIRFQTGANLGTGGITLDGGGLQWATGNTLDISTRLNALGSNGAVLDTNGNNVTLASALTGANGQLIKQGAGTLTLTGNNTYDGVTQIDAGDVVVGNGGTTGSIAGDIVNNTQLSINRSDAATLAGAISGAGTLVQAGTGTTILTGNNTYTGNTLVNAGGLQLGNGGTSGSLAGNVSLAAGTKLAVDRSDISLLPGIVSGAGSFEQIGTGATVLAGDQTYTGGTTITAGTLQLGNGGNTGSVLGDITNSGTLAFNRADDVTFSNAVSGTGGLTQLGLGTLNLAGDQTYTGATQVQRGTLSIGGSIRSDTSVAAGATLSGSGVIHGNVFNEGTLWPGNAIAGDTSYGTLTIKGDYVGNNGRIALNSFLGPDDSPSSKLVIDGGNASGTTNVVLHNTNTTIGQTVRDGILVIAATNGGTTGTDAFALQGPTRSGASSYRLFRGDLAGTNPDNWYLRNQFVVPPDPVGPDPVAPGPANPDPATPGEPGTPGPVSPLDPAPGLVLDPDPVQPPLPPGSYPIIGPEVATYGVIQPIARELGMLTLGTMNQRTGDGALMQPASARDDSRPAVWTRVFTSNIDNTYRAFAAPHAKSDLSGLQVGADLWQSMSSDGSGYRFGGHLAHSSADVRVRGLVTNEAATNYAMQHTGSVNLQANSAGAYWTHFGRSGWYLDAVVQASTYRGTASTESTNLSPKGTGVMGSLEFGYPFAMPQLGAGFVLEPQVQAVWQQVRFGEEKDAAGTVALGTTQGTSGRVGLQGKWQVDTKSGARWEPYVAVNYWRDWGGRATTVYSGTDSAPLLSTASRLEVSGGVTARLTSNLGIYASAGYQVGVGATKNAQRDSFTANAGIRFTW